MADNDLELNLTKMNKPYDMDENTTSAIVDEAEPELKLGKKKRKKAVNVEAEEENTMLWPDYSYEEMLALVLDIMRGNNPEPSAERYTIMPPEVGRVGSKKTSFNNFNQICKFMKRDPKHVMQFFMTELGTSGSIDGRNCLIVKGRFQQKHFESVLTKYIKEYVMYHSCKGTDTSLTKDTRLFFLQCHNCGSRCSVAAVKSGFSAVVGKRAVARRAAELTVGA